MGPRTISDISELFNLIFEDDPLFQTFGGTFGQGRGQGQGRGKRILGDYYSCPSYPPANVSYDEEKNMYFDIALAGFNKDEIEISFQGDTMILKAKPKKEESDTRKYLHHRIKQAEFENKYFIPQDKYNAEKAKADFRDGMLKIYIPAKEPEKAKSLMIE